MREWDRPFQAEPNTQSVFVTIRVNTEQFRSELYAIMARSKPIAFTDDNVHNVEEIRTDFIDKGNKYKF